MPSPIRTAVRAVIINEGHLLTVKLKDRDGVFYLLPGGGQNPGETFFDTLKRECMEEVGIEVRIGDFLFVREYIGKNHAFSYRHANFHQVESVFRCYVDDPSAVRVGDVKDPRQIGYEWLPLETLAGARFFPKVIAKFVKDGEIVVPEHYLGDVN
jgi:8-oxo-dGTP pyrophosphatase MutT (NUDIX family)